MFEPTNLEKPSIHSRTFEDVNTRLNRACSRLREAIGEDNAEKAWIAAADVGNFAWMLVVKLEDKQLEETKR
jgi:hypothetical protein